MTYREHSEYEINSLIYNKGLKKALEFAFNEIKNCRTALLHRTYYIDWKADYSPRKDIIESYKFCKHFIEQATKKEYSVSNHRHH